MGGPMSLVSFELRADGIGVIDMHDVAGKNALSEPFVQELLAALGEATAQASLKVMVLEGTKEVFCAGASIDMLRALAKGEVVPTDILLTKAVLDVPVPVIAAMEGHAIGGGLALGAAADMAIIARESRYGASFMNMGFTPGMGATRVLQHVMSPALVSELLFTGEPKKGSFFEGKSGFNAILPRAEVLPWAMSLAARVAEKPRLSLEMLKRTLTIGRRQAFEQTLVMESLMHRVSFGAPDVLARIEEAYAQ